MRREFPIHVKRAAKERAGDNCEGCGLPFLGRRPEYHHDQEDTFGGEPVLENCQVLCPPCHRTVTRGRAPVIAKSNRVRDKFNGIEKTKQKIAGRRFNGDPIVN